MAVECLKRGAYDYLPKPYELDELKATVQRGMERFTLRAENRELRTRLERGDQDREPLGSSAVMLEVERLVDRIAPTDVTVLVLGESGTGKELVARALHRRSARSGRPFVALNCAALPEELVESELFGHERGAFTGAVEARKGKFEQADSGTLFLDEVAEMTTRTQSKLLRVLQERTFERVGGARTIAVDVRVIAATNQELLGCVGRGSFREDLYYRLKVACLNLPPLRERPEDVPALAARFLALAAGRLGRGPMTFAPEALRLMCGAPWPGNVRELKNAVEYAAVMSEGEQVRAEALPADLSAVGRGAPPTPTTPVGLAGFLPLPYADARRGAIASFERHYVEGRLRSSRGNVSEAAREMGLARQSLQAKLKDLDIDPARFRIKDPAEPDDD